MAKRRSGKGGNASRRPRGNAAAQQKYLARYGRNTKACTGILHFGGPEIPIVNFRQSNNNNSTFLQSRCDTCNRLYFAIQQKPIKRLAAFLIFAISDNDIGWRRYAPASLIPILESSETFYLSKGCGAENCGYSTYHSDYRATAAHLTKGFSGLERLPKDSTIIDDQTGLIHPAPLVLHDLQNWAGKGGGLWNNFPPSKIWEWWQNFYSLDTAFCSEEINEEVRNPEFKKIAHPLSDFSWGAGNIKDTIQGHSVPAFNQVQAAASVLPSSSNIGGRVYGYLCEGDHLAMARFSRECKAEGMSLGHSPAPLRWLGKNDVSNGRAEPLRDNIQKRDSLRELHKIALDHPKRAGDYVSWQIRDLVVELGERKVTAEEFQQKVEACVEEYFDGLAIEIGRGRLDRLVSHLKKADPGKTEVVYRYRCEKLADWLLQRPGYSDS